MKNKSLISLLIGCAFLIASSIAIPFETSESAVSVQLQMVLVDNDGTRINQDVDVKVRLVLASVIGNISIWEKTYTNETIDNGVFYKVIGGLDDNNTELIAEMFDESNVDIELEVEDEVIPINLISQPFTIKSRISDKAHSVRTLMGLDIESDADIQEGSILMVQNGIWTVISPSDNISEIFNFINTEYYLDEIETVTINSLKTSEIILFDGENWINSSDVRLDLDRVEEIIDSKGFYTELNNYIIPEGEYPQILSIGEKIITEENIELLDDVVTSGNLFIYGELGAPLDQLYTTEIMLLNENNEQVQFLNNENMLNLNKDIQIEGRNGLVLSGMGSYLKLPIFMNNSEISYEPQLFWDETLNQLAIGSSKKIDNVKFNIEGSASIDTLMIGDSELNLNEFILESNISEAGKSSDYEDLIDKPDLTIYKESLNYLNDYDNKFLTDNEIQWYIDEFDTLVTAPSLTEQLIPYEPYSVRLFKFEDELENYYSKDDSEAKFVIDAELYLALSIYPKTTFITNSILINYIKDEDVSTVGKTGEYTDLLNIPETVLIDTFKDYKAKMDSDYITKFNLTENILFATSNLDTELTSIINLIYIKHVDLDQKGFGYQAEIDELSDVARTGEYDDVIGTPDLSVFIDEDDFRELYTEIAEKNEALNGYVKIASMSVVARTGMYEDMVDEPIIAEYQTIASMNQYISETEFNSEIDNILTDPEDIQVDLDSYLTEPSMNSGLVGYVERENISLVGKTGSFLDMLETENVVIESYLTTEMSNYITSLRFNELVNLKSEVSQNINQRIDEEEQELNDKLISYLNQSLSLYDVTASVDEKIAVTYNMFLTTSVNAEVIEYGLTLEDEHTITSDIVHYPLLDELSDNLDDKFSDFIVSENFTTTINTFALREEFDTFEWLSHTNRPSGFEDIMIEIGDGVPTSDEKIEIDGTLSVRNNFTLIEDTKFEASKLGVGMITDTQDGTGGSLETNISPNSTVQLYEDSVITISIQITTDETGDEVTDGMHIGLNDDGDAQVMLSENNDLIFTNLTLNNEYSVSDGTYPNDLINKQDTLHNRHERIRIDGSGNIGIGIDDPAYALDVEGDVNLTGALYQNDEEFETGLIKRSELSEDIVFYSDGNVGVGVINPSVDLEIEGTIKATSFEADASGLTGIGGTVKENIIGIWSGSVSSIPSGWALCDGSNGTPDLRSRFIVGYSGTGDYSSIHNVGGNNTYQLSTSQMPQHNHSVSMSSGGDHKHPMSVTGLDDHNHSGNGDKLTRADQPQAANWRTTSSTNHSHTVSVGSQGSGDSVNNMPDYYVIAFIMKL